MLISLRISLYIDAKYIIAQDIANHFSKTAHHYQISAEEQIVIAQQKASQINRALQSTDNQTNINLKCSKLEKAMKYTHLFFLI